MKKKEREREREEGRAETGIETETEIGEIGLSRNLEVRNDAVNTFANGGLAFHPKISRM